MPEEKTRLDESGLAWLWRIFCNALNGKVNRVDGKDLSSNDYTDSEKTKLDSIENGAQVNRIEHVLIDGVEQPIDDKTLHISAGVGAEVRVDSKTIVQEDGVLRVNTTDQAEPDNTQPITSAGVNMIVGNINAILETI